MKQLAYLTLFIVVLVSIGIIIANIFMFILIILPREVTRPVREPIAKVIMLVWVGMSRVLGMWYEDVYQKGNGV